MGSVRPDPWRGRGSAGEAGVMLGWPGGRWPAVVVGVVVWVAVWVVSAGVVWAGSEPSRTGTVLEFEPREGPPGMVMRVWGRCTDYGYPPSEVTVWAFRYVGEDRSKEPFYFSVDLPVEADRTFEGSLPVPAEAPPDRYGIDAQCRLDDQVYPGSELQFFVVTDPEATTTTTSTTTTTTTTTPPTTSSTTTTSTTTAPTTPTTAPPTSTTTAPTTTSTVPSTSSTTRTPSTSNPSSSVPVGRGGTAQGAGEVPAGGGSGGGVPVGVVAGVVVLGAGLAAGGGVAARRVRGR